MQKGDVLPYAPKIKSFLLKTATKDAFDTYLGIAYAAVAGSFICAVADNWNYNASNPCLHCGGNYNQNQNHGLFYVNYNTATNTNANIGCRILVIAGPHQRFRASAWLASFW